MLSDNATFIIFTLISILFCDSTSSECTRLTTCSCVFKDGHGFNLTSIVNEGTFQANGYNHTFYFQPCKNVPIHFNKTIDAECSNGKGVSLCVHDQQKNKVSSLGMVEDLQLEVQQEHTTKNQHLILIYRHGNITTSVKTLCCSSCYTHFDVDFPPTETEYKLLLISPKACEVNLLAHSGLSTGSVLVILFFIFTGLYFIGGAMALKFLRGATGIEMLPNHEFWCELPSLVRDGIVFAFNCCKADSYQRI